MAVFRYKTYDGSGRMLSGIIDADSTDHATSKLKSKGLFPFEVTREAGAAESRQRKESARGRIKKSEITAFTRLFASLLTSGMPVVDSLTALSEQISRATLRKTIVDIKEKVSSGMDLSEAFSRYPDHFSKTFVNLVKAGERGGELDQVLDELAGVGEKQEALRGKFMAAMIYPILMTIIGAMVLTILFILVIPRIISIFTNMGQTLPLPTKILVWTTNTINTNWPFILAAGALFFLLLLRMRKSRKGRFFIDRAFLKLPVTGKILCRLEVSRFARTFSLLLKGGVPITEALDIAKDVVKNSVIVENIGHARDNIAEGGHLSPVLKEGGIFPPVAVHMIAVGEKGGNLEEMLLNISKSFDREVENFTAGLSSIIEPVLIIAMGLAVGFIAMAILLPIFEMNVMVGK
ncbi:MAG: type II secretion system F family protein [Deltaproteobacteria bacterium]|nr:type II secretion system F family protein [Deltaproteobacteria bacterium]